MSHPLCALAVAALVLAGFASAPTASLAAPLTALQAAKSAAPNTIEPVQIGHRGHRGAGIGAGIVGGVIIGSMLAPRYYYDDPYYYGRRSYYAAPPRVYAAPEADDAVAYCMRRFRSYDPRSGTYLGYDGNRHPCP